MNRFSQRATIVSYVAPTTIDSVFKQFYSSIIADKNKNFCEFKAGFL